MEQTTIPEILLVEDNPDDRDLFHEYLLEVPGFDFRLTICERFEEAQEKLACCQFHIIVLDLGLPDSQGLSTFHRLHALAPKVPKLVLTGLQDEELGMEAVRHGAQDYLHKGQLSNALLVRSIRHAIERQQHEEALRISEESFISIVNANANGIMVLDQQGVVRFTNPAIELIMGKSAAELIEHKFEAEISAGSVTQIDFAQGTGEIKTIEIVAAETTWDSSAAILLSLQDITKRRQAEVALQQSEARYRTIIEATTDYIYTVRIENGQAMQTVHWPGCEAVTGYTQEEFQTDHYLWYNMVYPEDRDAVREHATMLLGTTQVHSIEHRLLHKDGRVIWVENKTVPRCDEQGKLIAYDALVTDITLRKIAQLEETRLRQRLQALWDIVLLRGRSLSQLTELLLEKMLALTKSQYGFFGFVNEKEQMLTVHAWSKEVMKKCGVDNKSIRFPVEKAGIWAEALRLRQPFVINDYNVIHPAKKGLPPGHVDLKSILAVPVFSGDSIVALGVVANRQAPYSQDIVEDLSCFLANIQILLDYKIGEDELARVRRALETLSAANEKLVRTDDELQLMEGICKILITTGGYRFAWIGFPEQTKKKKVTPVKWAGPHGEYLKKIKVTWDDTKYGCGATGRAIKTGETVICSNFGQAPWKDEADIQGFQASIALPLKDKQAILGVLTIYTADADAFSPKEVKLLEELAEDLAYGIVTIRARIEQKKATEETRELEKQLQQAQKMESIGTLAGGIAHDFNNILSAILGFGDILKRALPPGHPEHESVDHILQAGKRARDLVRQILTFSRQEKQERYPLQVHLIVKETLKLLGASIPSSIEISQRIDPKCGTVMASPTEIHQIVMNLGTNAYHAMREQGGQMEVALEVVEVDKELAQFRQQLQEGQQFVKLTVKDSGHGMDETTLERIFEPYFTTKPEGEGTGLGMSVVYGIVDGLQGAITVDSTPGQGTIFQVYLPCQSLMPEEDVREVPKSPGGTERIMFVDDEPSLALFGQKVLSRLGYAVTARTSSVEALEAFRAQPDKFDLIITDLTMPKITGLQFSLEIHKLRPKIPIIGMTGFSGSLTSAQIEKAGIYKIVQKPFITEQMAKIVRKTLDGEKDSSR